MARDLGMDLIVHVNPEGLKMGTNPFVRGSTVHTDIMKTHGESSYNAEPPCSAKFNSRRYNPRWRPADRSERRPAWETRPLGTSLGLYSLQPSGLLASVP